MRRLKTFLFVLRLHLFNSSIPRWLSHSRMPSSPDSPGVQTGLDFLKDTLHIIERTERHALMAQNTICRTQVEMKIGNGEFADIALAGKSKGTHFRFHENFLVLLALETLGVDLFQKVDGPGDTVCELVKSLFLVREEDVFCAPDP